MTDFNRKVEDASARVSQTIPAVRTHSTKALRVASKKLTEYADYMEQHPHPPK